MAHVFDLEVAPLLADDMIRILESGSAALDAYLGQEIYVHTDPEYLTRQRQRLLDTVKLHRERVGNKPTYLLRAPGRLNAFLEYLDMCDGDHMSTTIDGDIPLAVSPREDDLLNVGNTHPLFAPQQLSIMDEFDHFSGVAWDSLNTDLADNWDNRSLLIPHYGREQGHWLNYVLSPFMRVLWEQPQLPIKGADITFGPATVPFRAGTSSSSAVVVLSFLALYAANQSTLPRWTVTEVCKLLGEAEWYVGTHGGANDQMTILLNAANSVSYNRHSQPELGATPLPFLRGVHVVLANSLWEVNKSAGGNQSFNMRKGWMQMGDELMKLIIASVQEAIRSGRAAGEGWLGKLVHTQFGFTPGSETPLLENNLAYWEQIAASYRKFGSLHEDILGVPNAAVEELIMLLPVKITPAEAGAIFEKHAKTIERIYTKPKRSIGGYHIRTTARFFYKQNIIGRTLEHIFLEAEAGVASGAITPASPEYDAYRTEVGNIVDILQDALTFDFRVSIPQLDLLLSIAKRGPGYLGGKLTGAGKGGCVSLLVREEHSQAMCEYLDQEYYRKPERFEFYRQVLTDEMRFSEPGSKEYESAKERMQILDHGLACNQDQRRVITFSHGACALKLADI
ncbi:MAG: GHMP family kinase ATP-binding protein [Armatimonadota bacterium]